MSKRIALAVSLLVSIVGPALGADLPLSVAQVEKVTGQSGLTTKPAKYDKVGTNFVTAQGTTVITLKVASTGIYDIWKSQPSMDDQVTYAGVGEDAVASKKGRYICFKKAGQGVCVVGGIELPGKPALATDAHVVELAKLAASK
jgi:hypothetical protein